MSASGTFQTGRLDSANIAAWADAIAAGNVEPVRVTFRSHGARGPEIIWNPHPDSLKLAPLRFLLQHWLKIAGDRPMPLAKQIDAVELRPALGFVSLLDVLEQGEDFRYRLSGTVPSAVSGFDMTRHLLSQHKASPYMVEYFMAVYRAMLRRREPVYTEHGPPATIMTHAWHRIGLPLCDEAGAITRFLVANVPVGRDGKAITIGL